MPSGAFLASSLTVPLRMYGNFGGTLSKASGLMPKFLARTSFGVCETPKNKLALIQQNQPASLAITDHERGPINDFSSAKFVWRDRRENYPIFSKSPSSKASRYSFSSSSPWTLCATPLGKYQISPVSSFSVVKPPSSSTPVRSRLPL